MVLSKKIGEKMPRITVPKAPGDPRAYTLTPKQAAYVEARSNGMNIIQAAQAAGYANPDVSGYAVERSPAIAAEIQKAFKRNERKADMSKKKVMDGMLYAIDQAKILADPTAQIAGWREIAKMCGYYEAKKVQVDISVSAKRIFSQFETMSDAELLRIAETEIIDVDATDLGVTDGDGDTESEGEDDE